MSRVSARKACNGATQIFKCRIAQHVSLEMQDLDGSRVNCFQKRQGVPLWTWEHPLHSHWSNCQSFAVSFPLHVLCNFRTRNQSEGWNQAPGKWLPYWSVDSQVLTPGVDCLWFLYVLFIIDFFDQFQHVSTYSLGGQRHPAPLSPKESIHCFQFFSHGGLLLAGAAPWHCYAATHCYADHVDVFWHRQLHNINFPWFLMI